MKITSVESFKIEIPISEEQQKLGYYNTTGVTRIRTDEGITGYGWCEVDGDAASALLLGKDPFQVEGLVADGLGHDFYGAENALWDIVGKSVGQPLHRLWGSRDRMKLYLTTVWQVDMHQTQVTPQQQAEDMAHLASFGYKAFKFRIWRPDPMDDVEIVRQTRSLLGGPDEVELMLDRTGDAPGEDWDDATGLRVADALHEAGAQWLEEPFVRGDIKRHAKLRAAARIPITGGEHQPLQVGATIPSCRLQEVVYTTPPIPPTEAWSPLNALVNTESILTVEDGYAKISDAPGLGIDVNAAAVSHYRVS